MAFRSQLVRHGVSRPTPCRLSEEVEEDAAKTEEHGDGEVGHSRFDEAVRVLYEWWVPFGEAVAPAVLEDGDCDHERAGSNILTLEKWYLRY